MKLAKALLAICGIVLAISLFSPLVSDRHIAQAVEPDQAADVFREESAADASTPNMQDGTPPARRERMMKRADKDSIKEYRIAMTGFKTHVGKLKSLKRNTVQASLVCAASTSRYNALHDAGMTCLLTGGAMRWLNCDTA